MAVSPSAAFQRGGAGSRTHANANANANANAKPSEGKDEGESKWSCPACGQCTRLPERLARHMYSCCPELIVSSSTQFELAQKLLPSSSLRGTAEGDEEEKERLHMQTLQEAKRHEVTWRQLRARPKAAGVLSEKEEMATMEALDFAKRRESVILAAATHIAFYSPHMPSAGPVGPAQTTVSASAPLGALEEEPLKSNMKEVSLKTPIPLSERVKQVCAQLHLKYDRVHLLLKRKIKAEPLVADEEPVEVIYENEDWLCVNKPPLLRTAPRHRFEGKSLVNRAIGHVQRNAKGKEREKNLKPYVLHRLDMDTSGVVLFSKRQELAAFVQEQFRERSVKKHYLAICYGNPPDCFVVDDALERKIDHEIAMKISDPNHLSQASKPAKTLFITISRRRLEAGKGTVAWELSELHPFEPNATNAEEWTSAKKEDACLVCAIPLSGRTHQIRLHLAHAGFPILGDPLYGMGGKINDEELMTRQALHAFKLQLQGQPKGAAELEGEGEGEGEGFEPSRQKKLAFLAPLPQDMKKCLGLLNIEDKDIDTINKIIEDKRECFS